jgi:hypothetical protein
VKKPQVKCPVLFIFIFFFKKKKHYLQGESPFYKTVNCIFKIVFSLAAFKIVIVFKPLILKPLNQKQFYNHNIFDHYRGIEKEETSFK